MSWKSFTTADVLAAFNDSEKSQYDAATYSDDLGNIVLQVCDEFQGAIKSRTTDVPGPAQLPAGFIGKACQMVIWRFLNKIPAGTGLLTEQRAKQNERAEKLIDDIRAGKAFIEPSSEVNRPPMVAWNSENKVILRTHPTPAPSQQFPPSTTAPGYANPNAPADN